MMMENGPLQPPPGKKSRLAHKWKDEDVILLLEENHRLRREVLTLKERLNRAVDITDFKELLQKTMDTLVQSQLTEENPSRWASAAAVMGPCTSCAGNGASHLGNDGFMKHQGIASYGDRGTYGLGQGSPRNYRAPFRESPPAFRTAVRPARTLPSENSLPGLSQVPHIVRVQSLAGGYPPATGNRRNSSDEVAVSSTDDVPKVCPKSANTIQEEGCGRCWDDSSMPCGFVEAAETKPCIQNITEKNPSVVAATSQDKVLDEIYVVSDSNGQKQMENESPTAATIASFPAFRDARETEARRATVSGESSKNDGRIEPMRRAFAAVDTQQATGHGERILEFDDQVMVELYPGSGVLIARQHLKNARSAKTYTMMLNHVMAGILTEHEFATCSVVGKANSRPPLDGNKVAAMINVVQDAFDGGLTPGMIKQYMGIRLCQFRSKHFMPKLKSGQQGSDFS